MKSVIACHGSKVHLWPQSDVPEALGAGHMLIHLSLSSTL